VRVYAWDGTAWTKRGLDIDGEASSDYFGQSVSLSALMETWWPLELTIMMALL
jgi:hypothetical protein